MTRTSATPSGRGADVRGARYAADSARRPRPRRGARRRRRAGRRLRRRRRRREQAVFGFTEVKLGILPAVISPYALAKIGRSAARELFLTGMRFNAARARDIGLVHAVVPLEQLDEGRRLRQRVPERGPDADLDREGADRACGRAARSTRRALTAGAIAARRVSKEGQEGLRAFLEKRKPRWDA